ncbi:MAG: hypothetical protein AB1346_01855 [Thermodesulfobacteriota bacterium]
MRAVAFAALLAALLASGCGPKAITAGSRPFPSERAVFVDSSGKAVPDLPVSGESFRLVVLDFPWCPACGEVWKAVGSASAAAAPGSFRVYRILFDREIGISAEGRRETDPMRPAPPPGLDVETLTAIPGAFMEEYRVRHVPVLLLIERDGKVARRWIGYSTKLPEELAFEFRKRAPAPSSLPPGT